MSEKQPMAEAHEDKDGFLRRSDMTLRDYFAGQALAGMMANEKRTGEHVTFGKWAKEAYYFADAMLEARK